MMDFVLTSVNIDEVLRYMGCPPEQADETLKNTVGQCASLLLKAARPRWAFRAFPISHQEGGIGLSGGLLLPGKDISSHLEGCDQVVLFCATLSAQVDQLIRQAESRDMLQALCLDCCATAAVEQLCDQVEEYIHGQYPNCYFPFRYSPGYGDLPLSVQGSLLSLLDAPRKLGLCSSSSYILTPRKSVTALIGVSSTPVSSSKRSCVSCPAGDHCQYRKAGGHCGSA